MKKHLSTSIATILALIAPGIAKAQLYVTTDFGGIPTVSGATLENFDESSPSILTFAGSAGLTTGNVIAAPPYFSGLTAAFFGESPASGPDNTQFALVNGFSAGSATLSFSTPQHYFGLFWGSVDTQNTLTFYDSANNVIGTVFGTEIPIANSGDQGPNGTFYVNITSTTAFSRVVATCTGGGGFEFDDVAYSPVPEPTGLSLLAIGMFGITLLRRRK